MTLQQNYKKRKLANLQEKLQTIDKSVLDEQYQQHIEKLLIEAKLDEETVNKAMGIIQRLNAIEWPQQLTLFKTATKKASDEMHQVLRGEGRTKGIIGTIANLFKRRKDNPFIDAVSYASGVNNFFKRINKYVSGNVGGAVTANAKTVGEKFGNNKKTISKLAMDSLKPSGMLAGLSKTWAKKYLQGPNQIESMANQLMNLSIEDWNRIAPQVISQLEGVENVSDIVAATEQSVSNNRNEPVDAKTEPTQKEQPTTSTMGTSPTKNAEVKPGAAPPPPPKRVDKSKTKNKLKAYLDGLKKEKKISDEDYTEIMDSF